MAAELSEQHTDSKLYCTEAKGCQLWSIARQISVVVAVFDYDWC